MNGVIELRVALDITQKDLAAYLEVSTGMVGLVETRKREFSQKTIARFLRLERAYNLSAIKVVQEINAAMPAAPPNAAPPATAPPPAAQWDLFSQGDLAQQNRYLFAQAIAQSAVQTHLRAYQNEREQQRLRRQRALEETLARSAAALYKQATLNALAAEPPADEAFARLEAGWIAIQQETIAPHRLAKLQTDLAMHYLWLKAQDGTEKEIQRLLTNQP